MSRRCLALIKKEENMRRVIISVLVILLVVVACLNIFSEITRDNSDTEDYGILNGQLFDDETSKPVNEPFLISVSDSGIKRFSQMRRPITETDKNGEFSCKLKPGMYLLYSFPKNSVSKYCSDKNPFTYPATKQIVKIERGKITKAIKKTKYAGRIKLRLISKDGTQVNPGQLFGENADIKVRICGKSLLRCMSGIRFTNSDDFNDGEILLSSLCPDLYSIYIKFGGLGIPSVKIQELLVQKNEIAEVDVNIFNNKQTGIRGRILSKKAEPIENAKISFSGPVGNSKEDSGYVYSDQSGYFEIVDIREGLYRLNAIKEIEKFKFLNIPARKVAVKMGTIVKIEILVDTK